MRCVAASILLFTAAIPGCGNGGNATDASSAARDLAIPPDDLLPHAARCREAADCPVAGNSMDPVYFQCVAVELLVNDWLWNCAPQSKCKGDPDCAVYGANCICEYCGGQNGNGCVPGCNVGADCLPGMACDQTHRCRPHPCAESGDCPAFDECGGDAGCARRPCAKDGDCHGGYCIADPFQPASHHCSVLPGICGD